MKVVVLLSLCPHIDISIWEQSETTLLSWMHTKCAMPIKKRYAVQHRHHTLNEALGRDTHHIEKATP